MIILMGMEHGKQNKEVETQEKVVNTRGIPEGKFTFTSHGAGEHKICLRTNYTGGWFSTPQVKMHLDISVGESRLDKNYEREHVKDLAGRVKELNNRLQDIRREQQFQREREILFRDLSEATNHRAVWWSLLQIVVLVYMCVWQLRHLRGFFESKSPSPSSSSHHFFFFFSSTNVSRILHPPELR